MDFFQRQDVARKNTSRLIVYFTLAVMGIVLSVYLAAAVLFAGVRAKSHRYTDYSSDQYQSSPAITLWNPQLFGCVAAGTLAVIGLGCAYKISALSGGGSVVAESLGGRLISPGTANHDERKLLNVVEEMSIASGVPMPQVYVMDNETGINAFAAGHTPSDAAVAVTRGCLQALNRDELQGVIGHEFSHILNGDMRLNLRLMGVIFGIVSLVTIGRILLRIRSSGRNQNPMPIFGLVLILIGALGAFFANLIQAAVSRQREFLADASSVQFTRNPLGLSSALQKLGSAGSELESDHAQEASHMFFGNGLKSSFFNLFATHPPLEERIKAIDPTWDGTFKPAISYSEEDKPRPQRATPPPIFGDMAPVMGLSGIDAELRAPRSPIWQSPPPLPADRVLPDIGEPKEMHLRYAEQFRAAIPEDVKLATRDSAGAAALVFALLLDEEVSLRRTQRDELARRFPAAQTKMVPLERSIADLTTHARLPLVSLALPALRQLSAEDYRRFDDALRWLIQSDGEVDLFEFTLQKILQRHLAPQFGTTRRVNVQYYSVKPLVADCSVLLSALARVGSTDPAQQQQAFAKGAPNVRAPQDQPELLPAERSGLAEIGTAMDRLALAAPQIKKNVLEACVLVVGADGTVLEHEAELLRAIADTLDCPIPPFVTME